MAYDRADWHYGGDFPADLPTEAGATHIGLFLAWAIHRGLVGDFHRNESSDAVAAVTRRDMSGGQFLIQECDEKFWEEDLSDEGNAFAREYYADGYFADYVETLAEELPSIYHVADTWANFDRLAPVLDQRLQQWRARPQ